MNVNANDTNDDFKTHSESSPFDLDVCIDDLSDYELEDRYNTFVESEGLVSVGDVTSIRERLIERYAAKQEVDSETEWISTENLRQEYITCEDFRVDSEIKTAIFGRRISKCMKNSFPLQRGKQGTISVIKNLRRRKKSLN